MRGGRRAKRGVAADGGSDSRRGARSAKASRRLHAKSVACSDCVAGHRHIGSGHVPQQHVHALWGPIQHGPPSRVARIHLRRVALAGSPRCTGISRPRSKPFWPIARPGRSSCSTSSSPSRPLSTLRPTGSRTRAGRSPSATGTSSWPWPSTGHLPRPSGAAGGGVGLSESHGPPVRHSRLGARPRDGASDDLDDLESRAVLEADLTGDLTGEVWARARSGPGAERHPRAQEGDGAWPGLDAACVLGYEQPNVW